MDLYLPSVSSHSEILLRQQVSILANGTMVGRHSSRSGSAPRRVTNQIDYRVRCYSRFDLYKVESDMVDLD